MLLLLGAAGCRRTPVKPAVETVSDLHSYSRPEQVRVRHVDLDLEVLFAGKTLKGAATLTLERKAGSALVLDTRDLRIEKVETSPDGRAWTTAQFQLGPANPILGAPLTVTLAGDTKQVRIHYSTSPGATALQWLEPAQTAGKTHPFLFTQSQAIHARSWIPLQDSPGVRVTYTARIRAPKPLTAVMSAESLTRDGEFSFRMEQAIPPYLIALAVGELEFRPIGQRAGVYAEKPVIERAAREFEDTEKMIQAAEKLYGPYRWGRYDILVLPPSFPFGGMENPRLTFATPTVLAGDKSLVSLVAHELAHSWSGNLVTNATWRDFWLNEGFTVYIEQRILEQVYGPRRAEMEEALARGELQRELDRLPARDQILHIDLAGRDPDDGMTEIPYLKGALFLKLIEKTAGREHFDAFLRGYFDRHSFQSITTAAFLTDLRASLPAAAERVPIDEWIEKPGLPRSAPPPPVSEAFTRVEAETTRWIRDEIPAARIAAREWSTQEWLHFLNALPKRLETQRMAELDRAFKLTGSGNAEILQTWLLMSQRNGYIAADKRLEEFLLSVGRRKYLKPLYEELVRTADGKRRAQAIYAKARPGYHPITAATIGAILK
ncbi:MAG: M1 family metallopeptidase [Acidobacteria bacterium]|nr:M1 family metallopeptidase [Acidobacteriota bacterium]